MQGGTSPIDKCWCPFCIQAWLCWWIVYTAGKWRDAIGPWMALLKSHSKSLPQIQIKQGLNWNGTNIDSYHTTFNLNFRPFQYFWMKSNWKITYHPTKVNCFYNFEPILRKKYKNKNNCLNRRMVTSWPICQIKWYPFIPCLSVQ